MRGSVVLSIVVSAALVACKRDRPAVGSVPTARGPIVLDGELGEPDWDRVAERHEFVSDGGAARPYSEIRLLRDADRLYVALYAADEDIRSTDHFDVAIGATALRIDPAGHVTPAIPGVTAVVDIDEGTIDRSDDDDEEWVVELALPLSAIRERGTISARASRCDTPKDGRERCGAWQGSIQLGDDASLVAAGSTR